MAAADDESWVYISGVELGRPALLAVCRDGLPPSLIVSYAETLSHLSGYTEYSDIASHFGIPIHRTEAASADGTLTDRIRHGRYSVAIVLGWSELLDDGFRALFHDRTYGFHPTDLPYGRGRAPIPWQILLGVRESAVTLFQLDHGVDSGPIVGKERYQIGPYESATEVYDRVARVHASLLQRHIAELLAPNVTTHRQVGVASYYPRRQFADGQIDFGSTSESVALQVRALTRPYPGAWCRLGNGQTLLVWEAEALPAVELPVRVGRFAESERMGGLLVKCQVGALRIVEAEYRGSIYRPASRLVTYGHLPLSER